MALPSFDKPEPLPRYLQDDYDWADTHFPELANQYPEEWVAVSGRQVIAHGAQPGEVSAEAYRLAGRPHVAFLFIERRLHLY